MLVFQVNKSQLCGVKFEIFFIFQDSFLKLKIDGV
jgi:hypothetical protein